MNNLKKSKPVSIGVIGCGHWGPNHIRVFSSLPQSEVLMCSDLDDKRLKAMAESFEHLQTTKRYQDILENDAIDAVCVASPTKTHFPIVKEALEHGKHVLCEKPLTLGPEQCRLLNDLAQQKNRILMVGHIFLFNAGIVWLKEYIKSGALGKVFYAYSTRTNLGPFRYDVNALWDLAPHDISIFNYLLDGAPLNASARGHKYLGNSLEDMAFAALEYPNNIAAHLHVSWLDPKKVRQITLVGDKQMVVWDDLDMAGPIKIYDKHVDRASAYYATYGEFQLLSKEGNTTIPKIALNEPLKVQDQYFLDCILSNRAPDICDGKKAADVVQALCAIQKSMDQMGASVVL